jgi:uncharacterized C2H2 Zn-finger protein
VDEHKAKRHYYLVHVKAEENVICDFCSKSFKKQEYYKDHLRKIHGIHQRTTPMAALQQWQ